MLEIDWALSMMDRSSNDAPMLAADVDLRTDLPNSMDVITP
jgi:hypothetical protein